MDEIEDILKRMTLRAPSSRLDERVLGGESESTLPPQPLRGRWWRTPAYLSAAAMFAIGATIALTLTLHSGLAPVPDGQDTIAFEPVRHDTLVSHLSDEGVVFLNDQLPMRRIKRQTIQRVQWVDDAHAIRMQTTLPPQEQWFFVPLSFD